MKLPEGYELREAGPMGMDYSPGYDLIGPDGQVIDRIEGRNLLSRYRMKRVAESHARDGLRPTERQQQQQQRAAAALTDSLPEGYVAKPVTFGGPEYPSDGYQLLAPEGAVVAAVEGRGLVDQRRLQREATAHLADGLTQRERTLAELRQQEAAVDAKLPEGYHISHENIDGGIFFGSSNLTLTDSDGKLVKRVTLGSLPEAIETRRLIAVAERDAIQGKPELASLEQAAAAASESAPAAGHDLES